MTLPASLTRYFETAMLNARRPAWLEVDESGCVLDFGGDLSAYGIDHLESGDAAEEHAPFLVGHVPVPVGGEVLPMLHVTPDAIADVHLVGDGTVGYVLLLEPTEDLKNRAARQQRRYESDLELRGELERDARGLSDALGVLILHRLEQEHFRSFARVPGWAREIWPASQQFDIEEIFPFLQSFLDEAEDIWRRRRAGILRSGPWTQAGPKKTELHLEAIATCLPPLGDVLMVELLGDEYWARQRVLQLARDRRLALDRYQREQDQREILLHCIVHDLKGPLTGIKGAVDLMAMSPDLPEDLHSLVDTAQRACRKQLGLIEDIVSVFRHRAQPEQSTQAPQFLALDIEEFAWRMLQDYEPSFLSSARRLHIDVAPDGRPLRARGERRRIERVFANLLENALRYTPVDGNTWIRVHRDDEHVIVAVENEGPNVPESKSEILFDRFARDPATGGSGGLGLFYCRITVQKCGGDIRHSDRPGGGAVFTFRLPVAE